MDRNRGFTIIELLVVIVTIGILAAISVVGYNSSVNNTKIAKTKVDLRNIVKVINMAKMTTGKTLSEITGEYTDINGPSGYNPTYNAYRCATSNRGANFDLRNLPDSDLCIKDMKATWDAIYNAAGNSINKSPPRDNWGSPYLLEANENESMYWDGEYCLTNSLDPNTGLPDAENRYAGTNDDAVKSVGPDGVNVWSRSGTYDDIWADVFPDKIECI
ncbi:MAG: type II secretion system protein [Candidatus Saccharibacteria bacterium]